MSRNDMTCIYDDTIRCLECPYDDCIEAQRKTGRPHGSKKDGGGTHKKAVNTQEKRDKNKAYQGTYYTRHRAEKLEKARNLTQEEREKRNARARERYRKRRDAGEIDHSKRTEYYRMYREKNRDCINAYMRRYYAKNREKLLDDRRRRRNTRSVTSEQRKQHNEYNRRYYWGHREREFEKMRRYYQANKERIKERNRIAYQKKKEQRMEKDVSK